MDLDLAALIAQLDLRILTEFDPGQNLFVSQCIDTGALTFGASGSEAETLMAELLRTDLQNALCENSLQCIFHAGVPSERKSVWYESEMGARAGVVRIVVLRISVDADQGDVCTEARFLSRSTTSGR